MNKPLSLLFLATLSCGAISLAAYSANKDSQPVINKTIAEGNTYTMTFTGTSNTYSISGSTVQLTSQQNEADTAPIWSSVYKHIQYKSVKNSTYGAGSTITTGGLVFTKITLHCPNSANKFTVNYKIDGGDAITGTWDDLTMTIDNIHASTSFEYYNANTTVSQLRIQSIDVEYATSEDFAAVNDFVNANMHTTDVSFDDEGEGLCIKEGWYVNAKKELVKLKDPQIDIFKNNSYFAKYHERYLSWADANHDTSPYAGNGIILSNTTTIDKKNDNIVPLIVAISSFSLSFIILCSMLYSYKKERE